ncbi:protein GVQW3-like [Ornithodoros turicata]|uniref:protein GVQW3-like n=1 Tax=Ornithodoros turicata TaxID=34597 RepID=UPI00313877EE
MADNEVSAHIEQRILMRFLVNEDVKSSEIHRRLRAQYGHDTLSHSKAFEWCKRFRDGRTSVEDDPGRGGSEPSVRVPENIQVVERLVLKDRRITCLELARKTDLSVGTLNTIIHEHLQFRKVLRDVHKALKQKRPALITKGVLLLQDNGTYRNLAGSCFHILLTVQPSPLAISISSGH